MKILEVDQNTQEWFQAREGKITGSKAYDIMPKYRGTGYKSGFYKLIADYLAIKDESYQDPRDRGHSLEEEAAAEFSQQFDKKLVNVGMIMSDFDDDIALSPDKMVEAVDGIYLEAVEIKCLSSELHVEAVMENHIPSKAAQTYKYQVLHYFVVVDTIQTVWLAFYDPRMSVHQLFVIEFNREDYTTEIDELKQHEIETMQRVREAITKLAF